MTDPIVSGIEFTPSLPGVANPVGFVRCTINVAMDLTIVRTTAGRRVEFPDSGDRRGMRHALTANGHVRAAIERAILAAIPEVET